MKEIIYKVMLFSEIRLITFRIAKLFLSNVATVRNLIFVKYQLLSIIMDVDWLIERD